MSMSGGSVLASRCLLEPLWSNRPSAYSKTYWRDAGAARSEFELLSAEN